MKGTLNEYRKAKSYMELLYAANGCTFNEIKAMESLNIDYELAHRDWMMILRFEDIHEMRKTF
jgi:hypothetical protein